VSDAKTAETARIRAGIERTRAEMSGTIDAIQAKLSPEQITEQVRQTVNEQLEHAKTAVRDATIGKAENFMRDAGDSMNDARYSMMDTVRSNPIPAAMVALGLGWLFMNRSASPRRERYEQYVRSGSGRYGYRGEMEYDTRHPAYRGEAVAMHPRGVYGAEQHDEGAMARGQRKVGEAVGQAQSAVGGAVSQAQSAVGGAVSQAQSAVGDAAQQAASLAGSTVNRAQETAGALAGRTAYAAGRVEDQFQRALWESPLAVGAVALAVGAAAGFALPQTERENQLMGETRDSLVEQAQQVAAETVEKVQRVAGDVAQDATQKATEKAREVGLTGDKR
jgi:hypothetical protein